MGHPRPLLANVRRVQRKQPGRNSSSTQVAPIKPGPSLIAQISRITYKDPNGKLRAWESAERRTRPADSPVDGVGIIAILEKPTGPELLLQKQFRPPTEKVCIEVPAGLIDAGESPEQCAVRELKEETGYLGRVTGDGNGVSPLMFNGMPL